MNSFSSFVLIWALVAFAGSSGADGVQRSEDAAAPSHKQLLDGYRRYHSVCNHCHGPDGLGSSFGPSLILEVPDPIRFRAVVLEGARGPAGIMKGFAGNPNVTDFLDEILAYVDARARGALGRGRPQPK